MAVRRNKFAPPNTRPQNAPRTRFEAFFPSMGVNAGADPQQIKPSQAPVLENFYLERGWMEPRSGLSRTTILAASGGLSNFTTWFDNDYILHLHQNESKRAKVDRLVAISSRSVVALDLDDLDSVGASFQTYTGPPIVQAVTEDAKNLWWDSVSVYDPVEDDHRSEVVVREHSSISEHKNRGKGAIEVAPYSSSVSELDWRHRVLNAVPVAERLFGVLAKDYWTITAKGPSGFTIRFFNSSDSGISRTFDWVAKGYGEIAA